MASGKLKLPKRWQAQVDEHLDEIEGLINNCNTIDKAGYLQERLESLASWADEKICELDS